MRLSSTSPLLFDTYKACILKNLGDFAGRGARAALARAIGCQLAYLSRVLNQNADLSLEQASAAARHFSFSPLETDYFLFSVSQARAGTSELSRYWQNKKQKILAESQKLESRTQLPSALTEDAIASYYGNWIYIAVHVLASIPRFQTSKHLANHLAVPISKIEEVVNFLCSCKVAERSGQKIRILKPALHLPRESEHIGKHHINWKLRAINSLDAPGTRDFHYTSVVSVSCEDVDKIRDTFLEAIRSIRSVVSASPEERPFCYSLDLFEI